GENLALVRDGRRQDHVIDRHAVGGNQDQVVPVGVDVPDLARVQKFHDEPKYPCPPARECHLGALCSKFLALRHRPAGQGATPEPGRMVSRIEPPAASVALTRSVTAAPAGAVNRTRNRPPPCEVTRAARNVWPSLTDTFALAPVIRVAPAGWMWPTDRLTVCGPAAVVPFSARPATW